MPRQVDDRRRLVVPRWRSFALSAELGLLHSDAGVAVDLHLPNEEIERLRAEWKRHRTPGHAAEFLDAALLASKPEIAADAAEFLLRANVSPVSHAIASAVLKDTADAGRDLGDPSAVGYKEHWKRIAAGKRSLRLYPRNAIQWVNLAREYAIIGQNEQAAEALRRALALAPDDRFVLRAASRFFLHAQKPDRAHNILLNTARTKQDPWLLAAEIVTARAAEAPSRWIREGHRLVNSPKVSARSISELAAALGTIEYEGGTRRGVRRLFDRALEDPTENSVAQAAWVARHSTSLTAPIGSLTVPRAFEASAWMAASEGNYDRAVEEAWKWLADEPFATRPAFFGSWIACAGIGDFELAMRFVRAIEPANPHDPRVLAQIVFCLASLDRLDEAEKRFADLLVAIRDTSGTKRVEWDVLIEADRGLIAFRRGLYLDGRMHYEQAIRLAVGSNLPESGAAALLYYAREVARALPAEGPKAIAEARQVLDVWDHPIRDVYAEILGRAERRLGGRAER